MSDNTNLLVRKPWILSITILLAVFVWIYAGGAFAEQTIPESEQKKEFDVPLATVQVQRLEAVDTDKTVELYGRSSPFRTINVSAESVGKVIQINIKKGQVVKKDEVIAQIDTDDLRIQTQQALDQLRLRKKEYDAAKSLKNKGLQGEVAYEQARAAYNAAKSQHDRAKLFLQNATIKAPISGVVDHLPIEVGDFVSQGTLVANILELDPIVMKISVNEQYIQSVFLEQEASIRLNTGAVYKGRVSYISKISSNETNTFPVEIEVSNSDYTLPAGLSAEVTLVLDTKKAVKITPSALALDEKGNLGIKTIIDERVKFVSIDLVKTEQDGVWLGGLGDSVDVIVVGQGFVRDGDQVIVDYQ